MKKNTFRKISLLGTILMMVSSVTAVLFSSKAKAKSGYLMSINGLIVESSSGYESYTCIYQNSARNCHVTADSGTTGAPLNPTNSNTTTYPDYM